MRAWRGIWAAVLATLGLCLALAAGAVEVKEGRDFRLISPPLASGKNTIEVTEFFWYGCPHCFDFEPILAAWVKKLPADVGFRRVPMVFPNNRWAAAARLYYTLEAENLVEKLHRDVFNTIHVGRQRVDDEKILFDWVATKGIDAKKFSETWSSAEVQGRVQQARELAQGAGITGVPSVMVQGRYLVLTPGNYEELLDIIDQLIERVRAETGRK